MSSAEQLAAQLKRLGHASSVFRRQAVVGVFQLLAAGAARGSPDAARDAALQCLTDRHTEVVDEAVAQLVALADSHAPPPGLGPAAALPLLLDAVDAAPPRAAPLLARGVVAALGLRSRHWEGLRRAGQDAPEMEAWSRHPLSAALLAQLAAAQQLLAAAAAALGAAEVLGAPGELDAAWRRLSPFFSFVLLRPLSQHAAGGGGGGEGGGAGGDAAAGLALRGVLVGALARAACAGEGVAARVAPFLLRHIACGHMADDAARLQAVSFVGDVVDILDAHCPAAAPDAAAAAAAAEWWWPQLPAAAALCISLAAQPPGGGPGGGGGGGGGPGALLPAMRRLALLADEAADAAGGGGGDAARGVWAAWIPELVLLAAGAPEEERCALFALAAGAVDKAQRGGQQGAAPKALPGAGGGGAGAGAAAAAWTPEAALMVVPLLQCLVLTPGAASKRWAAALLAAAQAARRPWAPEGGAVIVGGGGGGAPALEALCCQGPLVVMRSARQLLQDLWGAEGGGGGAGDAGAVAAAWLGALAASLSHARADAASAAAGGAAPFSAPLPSARALRERERDGGGGAAELAPAQGALLGALLVHTEARVVGAAAAALRELCLALPASAPAFLPPLLMALRRLCGGGGSGKQGGGGGGAVAGSALDVARAQAALLGVLPAMTSDPVTAAFATRALQPLAAPSAPPALRGAALRLAVDGWRATGRGWARAEAAINGYAPPGTTPLAATDPSGLGPRGRDMPPLELRLARAAALRDVCASGSGRALELVWSLQDGLADPCPAAAAMALDGLAALCADDAVDFYAAWRVVAGAAPRPPAAPLAAARWVALLGCGALDAEAHPEAAAAVVDLLWAAADHEHPLVRAASYRALAAYPVPLLEKLELDEPPASYTSPLAPEAAALTAALDAGGDGAGGAGEGPLVGACREALAGAEALAGVAIAHENERRRRFLAAAGAGPRGGGGGGGGGARDEAALRHRLLHTARSVALSGGGGGGAAADGGGASPGALLLLWQPAAAGGGAAGRGGGARGAAAGGGGGGYDRVFDDAAARMAWSPLTHPALAAAAWQGFMGRWLAAPGSPGAEGLLQALRARWREGGAGDAAAACWAAAGLAAGGSLGEAQMGEALAELRRLARGGGGGGGGGGSDGPPGGGAAPSAVAAAAAAAAARVLPAMHPADWKGREAVVASLRAQLLATSGGGGEDGGEGSGGGGACGGVRSAAAEALAYAACHALRLGHQHGDGGGDDGDDPGLALAVRSLALLLALAAALQPAEAAASLDAAEQLPPGCAALLRGADGALPDLEPDAVCDADPWLLAAARRGALSVAAALHERAPAPALLQALAAAAARRGAAAAAEAAAPPAQLAAPSEPPARRAARLAGLVEMGEAAAACIDVLPRGPDDAAAAGAALAAAACAPAVDGWLGAAAALGWARVSAAQLPRGLLPCGPGGAPGGAAGEEAAAAAAAHVVECLVALCGGRAVPGAPGGDAAGGGAHRGPSGWALRCGAAAGLAAMLGADPEAGAYGLGLAADGTPAAREPCWLLSPGGGGGGSAAAARVRAARGALRALEAAALGAPMAATGATAGGRLSGGAALAPLAGWLLAAASATAAAAGGAAGGAGGSGGGGGGDAPPLAAYPEDGALRPLAERLLLPGSGECGGESLGPVEAASLLRVLAAAPRLPTAGWEPLLRRLLRPAAPGGGGAPGWRAGAGCALHCAALDLALRHSGRAPQLGLAPPLDAALMPAAFSQLPAPARALLLRAAPDAVRCLPANRAAPLLQGLPGMVPRLPRGGGGGGAAPEEAAALGVAAWDGLRALCGCLSARDASISSKGVAQPLLAAIASLAERLPPLPPLLPGQALLLLDERGAGGDPGGGGGGEPRPPGLEGDGAGVLEAGTAAALGPGLSEGEWRVWRAALGCLRRVKQEQAAALTAVAPPPAPAGGGGGGAALDAATLLRAQLRCLLVLAGLLSWRELTPVRGLLLSAGGCEGATAAADALLPLAALAACRAPQAAQAQLLQEALAAAPLAGAPGAALALAAALVAAWHGAAAGPDGGGAGGAAAAAVDAALFCGGGASALAGLPHALPALCALPAWAPSADGIARGLLAAARLPGAPPAAAAAAGAAALAVRARLHGAAWEAVASDLACATDP
ncbi:MAG: hypothetical protein J3K34DRAFT_524154 [Monoraphidium minutum]|nr:MAG: hypothetical protein J3K34DRAFT_524154 [Monoraphidium minutum]